MFIAQYSNSALFLHAGFWLILSSTFKEIKSELIHQEDNPVQAKPTHHRHGHSSIENLDSIIRVNHLRTIHEALINPFNKKVNVNNEL